MEWMEVNGVALRYAVSGGGDKDLVLVHELGGALESWNDVLPALEKGFRVLRYDQRGFGLSEKSKGTLKINDMTGDIISSSRIRNGYIDAEGHPWFSSAWLGCTLRMHPRAEPELKTPMGELFEGPENMPIVAMTAALETLSLGETMLIAVGDVTVATLLDVGVVPELAFIDGQTKRTALEKDAQVDTSAFGQVLHATNPAGVLTPSLHDAIMEAMASDLSSVVVVDGEEDLAPLFVHLLAPVHAVVLYGQPGKGVVVQSSRLATKQRCRRLLELFEVL